MSSESSMQLEEIELMQAMYGKDEFIIDERVLSSLSNYVRSNCSEVPSSVEYTLHLRKNQDHFEVRIIYPRAYPAVVPTISVQYNKLSRSQHERLNSQLQSYLKSFPAGDLVVSQTISWIQENLSKIIVEESQNKESQVEKPEEKTYFGRHWIYSHHIYNAEKRRTMDSLARHYNLGGFSLCGKPGLVCVEGRNEDCEEWWQQIRALPWKKITCVHTEKQECQNEAEIKRCRKFGAYQELDFASNSGRSFRQDMGEFKKYLAEHGCEYGFGYYFDMGTGPDTVAKILRQL